MHFVWKHKLFNARQLMTTNGDPIVIQNSGIHNDSSGPDFHEARVTIGDTQWAGSIEIHVKSSDWMLHGHTGDKAYNNVILHVVYVHDVEVENHNGEQFPTLELDGLISAHVLRNFHLLRTSKQKIPCSSSLHEVSKIHWSSWLNRLLVQRLERKTEDAALIYKQSEHNWMQTFFAMIAAYLGQNHNKLPMLELARKAPINLLLKYVHDPLILEAILMGCAGFLEGSINGLYLEKLKQEFDFLRHKHDLKVVTQVWKTGRVRPDNSPSRRVAQLSAMVQYIVDAYSQTTSGKSFKWNEVQLKPSEFWKTHYAIHSTETSLRSINISIDLNNLLTINAHAPFMFLYAGQTGEEALKDCAIELLQNIKPEKNAIIRQWKSYGVGAANAADSQALIELSKNYCSIKNCINCHIGKCLISQG